MSKTYSLTLTVKRYDPDRSVTWFQTYKLDVRTDPAVRRPVPENQRGTGRHAGLGVVLRTRAMRQLLGECQRKAHACL